MKIQLTFQSKVCCIVYDHHLFYFILSGLGFTAMATTKALLKDETASTDITLLIIGRTGQGKSALANSIFEMNEKIAKEGADTDGCTAISRTYHYPNVVPGISIIVIDTPGLQDTQGKEDAYIQQMKQKHKEVSLVLYCMKMTDHRLCNDDKVAIKKLDQAFGWEFWERVVFVLTFANRENCQKKDERDENIVEPPRPYRSNKEAWDKVFQKRFQDRFAKRKESVETFIKNMLAIDTSFTFVPAGSYEPDEFSSSPINEENWLKDLLQECYSQIKVKHKFSTLELNISELIA